VRIRRAPEPVSERTLIAMRWRSPKSREKGERMTRGRGMRWVLGAAAAVSALMLSVAPASSHQNPPGCTGNNLGLDLSKNKTAIVSGDTVHYVVKIRNDAAGACDIDGAAVTFHCPAADGTPTGTLSTFVSGASFPAGFPLTTIGETDCVVS